MLSQDYLLELKQWNRENANHGHGSDWNCLESFVGSVAHLQCAGDFEGHVEVDKCICFMASGCYAADDDVRFRCVALVFGFQGQCDDGAGWADDFYDSIFGLWKIAECALLRLAVEIIGLIGDAFKTAGSIGSQQRPMRLELIATERLQPKKEPINFSLRKAALTETFFQFLIRVRRQLGRRLLSTGSCAIIQGDHQGGNHDESRVNSGLHGLTSRDDFVAILNYAIPKCEVNSPLIRQLP